MQKARLHHLDGIRGIAALAVVVSHTAWPNHIKGFGFASAGLWVDFFFVLSGFVIAYNYRRRLSEGFGLGNYMFRRMARIYPAHLAVLLVLLAIELAKYATESRADFAMENAAFAKNDLGSFLASLGLVQALGFYPAAHWNGPSWSISTEVWTYLLFGAAFVWLKGRRAIILATALIVGLSYVGILLNPTHEYLSVEVGFGFFRCLIGFGFGVICYAGIARAGSRNAGPAIAALQWLLAGIALLAVATPMSNSPTTLAIPLLFAAIVYLLAVYRGRGLERALTASPIQFLGRISYSLYISHAIAVRIVGGAFKAATPRLPGWADVTLAGDVATPIYAVLAIALGWLVWRFVETPANAWLIARLERSGARPDKPAAADPAF